MNNNAYSSCLGKIESRNQLHFSYGNVSYRDFSQKYKRAGLWRRKAVALPLALWSGIVQTTYHLAKAIFLGILKSIADHGAYLKKELFYVARKAQESFGRICSLFHDRYGVYHIQASQFHQTHYARFPQNRTATKSSPTQEIEALSDPIVNGKIEGVYITTNESNLEGSKKKLREKPLLTNSCHIGCAGWHNFDIMCLRKSSYGVISDFNPHNKTFLKKTLETLILSKNRHDFVEKISPYITKTTSVYSPKISKRKELPTPLKEVHAELQREGSWLATDTSFTHIKQLAESGNIATITTSITDTERLEKLRVLIEKSNLTVDTIYLSNIRCFIKEKEKFTSSINNLANKDTLIISCPTIHTSDERYKGIYLRQHVSTGAECAEDPSKYFEVTKS